VPPFTSKWSKGLAESLNFQIVTASRDDKLFADITPASTAEMTPSAVWVLENFKHAENVKHVKSLLHKDPPSYAQDFLLSTKRILEIEDLDRVPVEGYFQALTLDLLKVTGFNRGGVLELTVPIKGDDGIHRFEFEINFDDKDSITIVSVPDVVVWRTHPDKKHKEPKASGGWEVKKDEVVSNFGQIAGEAFALAVMNRNRGYQKKDGSIIVDVHRMHSMDFSLIRAHFPPNFVEELLEGEVPSSVAKLHVLHENNITLRTDEGRSQLLRLLSGISNSYCK